jgi:hypothetical protein
VDGGAGVRSATYSSGGLGVHGWQLNARVRRRGQGDFGGGGERRKKMERDGQHRSPPL